MPVDGELVARTVAELRAMPEAEDLLARLGRVVEATRTVVGVDGTGLTLTCEDGQPRWVAATDAAMQLLEEVQHDFGEGLCLDRTGAGQRGFLQPAGGQKGGSDWP